MTDNKKQNPVQVANLCGTHRYPARETGGVHTGINIGASGFKARKPQ